MPDYKLMVKTHCNTGLKYLCGTTLKDKAFNDYKGSGTDWKKHLAEFGSNITTDVLFHTEDLAEFKKVCKQTSIELDVVESQEWANLVHEVGRGWWGPHPQHVKDKIGESNRKSKLGKPGRPHSEETKLKISLTKKGTIFTKEHKQKLRESKLGTTRSLETRSKMSVVRKGRAKTEEHKRAISLAKIGKPMTYATTEEHKKNLSIAGKQAWSKRKSSII